MTYQIVCGNDDKVRWKAERNKLFTASDLNVLMGTSPDFFDDDLESVMREKKAGTDRIFGPDRLAAIEHGRVTEEHNLSKCSMLFGIPVAPFHYLVKDERWPYLGATLDAIGVVGHLTNRNTLLAKQHPSSTKSHRYETFTHCDEVRRGLEALQLSGVQTIVVEMKNTDGYQFMKKGEKRPWIEELPTYYNPQIQLQMHIMGLDHCLICGQLGAGNMTGWLVYRDPVIVDWFDEANDKAKRLLFGASMKVTEPITMDLEL